MLSFLSNFKHRKELRESKDEIMIGEIVRVGQFLVLGHDCVPFAFFHADDCLDFLERVVLDGSGLIRG